MMTNTVVSEKEKENEGCVWRRRLQQNEAAETETRRRWLEGGRAGEHVVADTADVDDAATAAGATRRRCCCSCR